MGKGKGWWAHLDSNPLGAKNRVAAKTDEFFQLFARRRFAELPGANSKDPSKPPETNPSKVQP
jgi:hypothetical protein